jgi:hypothetical protein
VAEVIVREAVDGVERPNKVVCDHFNDKKSATG